MCCKYLVFPSDTSDVPYSSPNESSIGRYASSARPSSRMFSFRATVKNCRSLSDGSISRGIVRCHYIFGS